MHFLEQDHLVFFQDGRERWRISHADIVDISIGGPGTVAPGGGFVGGGLGATGAAEGMLVASVLNAATSRATVTTNIIITATTGSVTLQSYEVTPHQLAGALGNLLATLRHRAARSIAGPAPSEFATIDALERLTRLRESGALSDSEYAIEKALLLRAG